MIDVEAQTARSSDSSPRLSVGRHPVRTFGYARMLDCCLVHGEPNVEYGSGKLTSLLAPSSSSAIIVKGVQPVIDPDIKVLGSFFTMAENILCHSIGFQIPSALPFVAIGVHSCRVHMSRDAKLCLATGRRK